MTWWMWAILGIGLAAAEVASPAGFWLVGFGIGAVVVSAGVAIGLLESATPEWLLFAAVSTISVLGLRAVLGGQLAPPESARRDLADVVGEVVVVSGDIVSAGIGEAELRGAPWRVRNLGLESIAAGARARVESVEGVTLNVRAV